MKKILLSAALIIVFIAYVLQQKLGTKTNTNTIPSTDTGSSNSKPAQANISYKDGEYTGPSTDAFYGNIRVKAVIQNGKISDVQFLEYPNDVHESIEVNTEAMPSLKTEAIQAQKANVDIVSGATQTSEAFRKSLQSALDQAKS
jgi:uncharacterized protein with FMN-binding domain